MNQSYKIQYLKDKDKEKDKDKDKYTIYYKDNYKSIAKENYGINGIYQINIIKFKINSKTFIN
jgi:hypothetical protein